MLEKNKKEYSLMVGTNMEIDEAELDMIACQIETVINTNFPHIRVHLKEANEDTSCSCK